MSEQAPSKEKLPDWLRRWYALKGEPRFREAADEIERLQLEKDQALYALDQATKSAAHEPPAECAGCEEFVGMQHDIASLLGVDADTDSIDLHGRIYGALSSSQPPPVAHSVRYDVNGWLCSVCHGWNDQRHTFCVHPHSAEQLSHPTKGGEQS